MSSARTPSFFNSQWSKANNAGDAAGKDKKLDGGDKRQLGETVGMGWLWDLQWQEVGAGRREPKVQILLRSFPNSIDLDQSAVDSENCSSASAMTYMIYSSESSIR